MRASERARRCGKWTPPFHHCVSGEAGSAAHAAQSGHVLLNHHLHSIDPADTQPTRGAAPRKRCCTSSCSARKFAAATPLLRAPKAQRLDYLLSTKEGTDLLFKLVDAIRRLLQTFGHFKIADQGNASSNGGRGSVGARGLLDSYHSLLRADRRRTGTARVPGLFPTSLLPLSSQH